MPAVANPKSTPKEIVGHHGHHPHGKSILWPALYEHLRRKGKTKAAAAAISNAAWKKKRAGMATNTPTSVRGVVKSGDKRTFSKSWSDAARKAALEARRRKSKGKSKWQLDPEDKDVLMRDNDGKGIDEGDTSFVRRLPKKRGGDGKNFKATRYSPDGKKRVTYHSSADEAMDAAKRTNPSGSDAQVKNFPIGEDALKEMKLPAKQRKLHPRAQMSYLHRVAVRANNDADWHEGKPVNGNVLPKEYRDPVKAAEQRRKAKIAVNAMIYLNETHKLGKPMTRPFDKGRPDSSSLHIEKPLNEQRKKKNKRRIFTKNWSEAARRAAIASRKRNRRYRRHSERARSMTPPELKDTIMSLNRAKTPKALHALPAYRDEAMRRRSTVRRKG